MVVKLNFCSHFEHKLDLGRDSEARFGQYFVFLVFSLVEPVTCDLGSVVPLAMFWGGSSHPNIMNFFYMINHS